ncbi:MAG: hypothetical protein ACFFE5_13540 [Candidatus Thorarchaeota archaeon]
MTLDNSNKRDSEFIAGILVITVISICLACAFGIWDYKVISNNNPLINEVGISLGDGNNIMENNPQVIPSGVGFLPVNEKIVKKLDTKDEGWLFFDQTGIPTELPLTITQADLDTWSVKVYSYGGYEFVNGHVDLYQKDWEYKGTLNYNVETSYPDTYTMDSTDYSVFVYELGISLADGEINLDSNYLPKLYDTGWMRVFDGPCPDDLDKEVIFKEKMVWSGCDDEDQQFRVILAYKSMLRSPELPIKNFIASFEQ